MVFYLFDCLIIFLKVFTKKVILKKVILILLIAIFSILFMVLSLTGCLSQGISKEDKISNKSGYKNDFTLLDLDENKVSLSDFKGKVIVLNFWATWCPPCRAEIPSFVEVYNQYKNKGVQFVGVSVDTDLEYLSQFVEEYDINYPILVDGTLDNVSSKWGISAIPTTFILDKDGEILFKNIGMMVESQLIEAIEKFL